MLTALAEPNRLRIVELLGIAPRTVGEIAATLGLRQPQVTKHLQTLERAGIVEVHPLGRRRVCALRRDAFEQLAGWAGELAAPSTDDSALARYRTAIASAAPSPVTVRRAVGATPSAVWRAFTDPALAVRWWHPRHFTVETFRFDARADGHVELALREGDGVLHRAHGQVRAADRPRRLMFTLDPLDPDGTALFTATHDIRLRATQHGTEIDLTITPSQPRQGAEPALGGLEIGWEQLLDNLAQLADDGTLERGRTNRSTAPT